MAPTIFLLVVSGLLFAPPSYAQIMSPSLEKSIDKISPQANFNPNEFAGKWKLDAVASDCEYLKETARKAYGVNIVVSVNHTNPQSSLLVDTFQPRLGICWQVKQAYSPTKTPGRFLLTGRSLPVDVVVGETDYSSYAIIIYQQSQRVTVKLYVRSVLVYPARDKFAAIVARVGLDKSHIHYFRTYGFCHRADQFHLLDETKSTSESE